MEEYGRTFWFVEKGGVVYAENVWFRISLYIGSKGTPCTLLQPAIKIKDELCKFDLYK